MIRLLSILSILPLIIGGTAYAQIQDVEQEPLTAPPGLENTQQSNSLSDQVAKKPEPKASMVEFTAPPTVIENEDRERVITKIEDTLNRIRTLKATFIQRDPKGNVDEGNLYIERPGKIRFEYTDDTPILLVSNGDML